jgi:hypothetical protein
MTRLDERMRLGVLADIHDDVASTEEALAAIGRGESVELVRAG